MMHEFWILAKVTCPATSSISELLLEHTAQQLVDCLCCLFWEWFSLGQLLTDGYLGVLAS